MVLTLRKTQLRKFNHRFFTIGVLGNTTANAVFIGAIMRILCLGDSIMQYNDFSSYPQTGWVQELVRFFPRAVEFLNFARNGRSTKSFIEEGRFKKVLAIAREGDYALIQFGHNDEKANDPTRYTTPAPQANAGENCSFRGNLSFFVTELKKVGVKPILLTPVARRKFVDGTLSDTHGEYPRAIIETAKNLSVPCIDMTRLTMDFLESVGEVLSRRFFMNFDANLYENYPDGKGDNSHLRPDGAYVVSRIAAEQLAKIAENFSDYAPLSDSVLIGKDKDELENDREIDDEFLIS